MKQLALFILLIASTIVKAQYSETIRSGRPGQSIGAFCVGEDVFQIQSGINFNKYSDANNFSNDIAVNSNIFRFGVLEKFELSTIINYTTSKSKSPLFTSAVSGISSTQIGGRYNITSQEDGMPAMGIQGRVILKATTGDFERDSYGSRFIYMISRNMSDKIGLTSNIIYTRFSGTNTFDYTFNFGYTINEQIEIFGEIYGNLNDFNINYDTGIGYFVNDNFKLDASTGWQGQNGSTDWFLDFGFSWRTDWRKN